MLPDSEKGISLQMIGSNYFGSTIKKMALWFALLQMMVVAGSGAVVYDTTAVAELTGSRTNLVAGGVDSVQFNNSASNHFSVSWVITNPVASTWNYSYTFSGTATTGGQGLSHFILDTSDTCINVTAGTLADPNCITSPTWTISPAKYIASPSNPNFPAGANIIGVKFNVIGGPALPVTITFVSDRAPVYGDFYLKVANSTSAYNNGLGIEGTSTLSSDFIAMPGELTPEPGTALLMLAGAALVGIGRLLRFRPPHLKRRLDAD
jgi:hypothetical protein